ncbi:MAG: excinuclease ABC subunit UvrA [Bdellovibrionales bacterium]|nr:excinuclease ABC subunit UvrA [Bdellovibrionales bacterium]
MNLFSKKNQDGIHIFGAREHNLKNINIFIPRNKITVITGLSGSGKSSLAFDTIYGEGQRRYLESLSSYARYFIDQVKKPQVDFIQGLSPSIAIHQKTISSNPRSTVGTLTESYDFIRLLYSKLADIKCPIHKQTLKAQNPEEIAEDIFQSLNSSPLFILSPIARGKKGEFTKELETCLSLGFDRAKINGKWLDIGNVPKLKKRKEHYIDILIDQITKNNKDIQRILLAVERALNLSTSYVKISNQKGIEKFYSKEFSCPSCDYSFVDLEPKLFSFNSPKGACRECNGTGLAYYDEEKGQSDELCPSCKGMRLKPEALEAKINNLNIHQVCSFSIQELKIFIESLSYKGSKQKILQKIRQPLLERLSFLHDLNLSYLSLNRSLITLSGGEAQRVRLAGQLSSPVIGVTYVLDEPSIGLHSKDHGQILKAIQKIKNRGNTIIVVEHDEESISIADKIIDLGPGAGKKGGYLTAEGTVHDIKANKKSLTGAYLSQKKQIPLYQSRYKEQGIFLELTGLKENNLKNINVRIPLGYLIGISGVSGSGKSSLVTDTIYPLLFNKINQSNKPVGAYSTVKGLNFIDRVIQINQKPIGRTPRSNPATYIGVFQMIRNFFAHLPSSKVRGYSSGFFSFNIPGGRCENCKGAGVINLEMRFLPNVFTTCEICHGKRYSPEILNITYKNKNIYDILNMNVDQALLFFKNHPSIYQRLNFLQKVGLGYITLGQSSLTLSGGEAQRIKLSKELSKKTNSKTFYILDEPTTGLHFQDVEKLLFILRQLSEQGHTVVVIEHHLDILKSCDYLIDLGYEGGDKGGFVISEDTPEKVSQNSKSATGKYLKKYFYH